MFSGIIKSVGIIQSIKPSGSTNRITISSVLSKDLTIDQSIAHDGVCLTIIHADANGHEVEVVQETLSKTTFAFLKSGYVINLEKSITPSTLLDGHLVQGHVDTVIQCQGIENKDGSWQMKFELPKEYAGLVIPQGSICLNGVSLTIARLLEGAFEVAIIPYTYEHTNFKNLAQGSWVNAEFDVIGKYLQRLAQLRMKP